MTVEGRVLRRLAMAALAASAAMLVPAASHGRTASAPEQATQPARLSLALGSWHPSARADRWSGDEATASPTSAAAPMPVATATALAPPAAAAGHSPESAAKPAVTQPAVAPPPPPPGPAASGGWYDAAYSRHVFDLVNVERARAGLGPLAVELRLAADASAYAHVLADGAPFSHTGPEGSTLVTRAEAAGFPFTVQEGEVLAWGNQGWTPEGIVRAWLNSPPHREEILSPNYTRAGIGCYFMPANGVTVYCDMDLAG